MSAYEGMSITEINMLAKNLRDNNEQDALIELAKEKGVKEEDVCDFYDKKRLWLIDPVNPDDDKIKKAIDKLDKSEESFGENTKYVVKTLTEMVNSNKGLANGILEESKTLAGSYKFVKEKAREMAKDGMAMIQNDTVISWVAEYFGLRDAHVPMVEIEANIKTDKTEEHKPKEQTKTTHPDLHKSMPKTQQKAQKGKLDGQVDIFSLLGGN